jgi:hypothetical protein
LEPDDRIVSDAIAAEIEFARAVQRAFQGGLIMLHERGRIRAAGGRVTLSHRNLRIVQVETTEMLLNETILKTKEGEV